MSNGELPEEYATKYVTKGVPKRGAKGDIVLVGMEHLQPENAVTMGVFTKMYNHVSRKGPLPIFNVVHNNFGIPLAFKNFNTKSCSVLGISTLQSASKDKDDQDNENDEYVNPSLIEKFDRRWDDEVITGKEVKEDDLKKNMSLKEFCDRFEAKWSKAPESNTSCLHLTIRRESFSDTHYPIRLVPHLSCARANPRSAKYWMYCKHLCLWLLPCKTIRELLPDPSLEDKELADYWIDKFDIFGRDDSLLPTWALRHYKKYHNDNESCSDDSEEEDNITSGKNKENQLGDNVEESSDESGNEDLDGDPRARRAENAFYQTVEEQAYFRNEAEPDLESDELSSLINISNPKGEDFMKWAKNRVLPSYNEINQRLNSLKNKDAEPDKFIDVVLNEKQRLFRDIVMDWVPKWALANEGEGPWPKALRLILMGSPGAGKSRGVRATMNALGNILGVNYKDVVRQATPTGCASFQMSAGATTVHKLFGLHVKSKSNDLDDKTVRMLAEKFKSGLCLLVIDEFSMESRAMIGLITSRLTSAHIDLNTVGIILIGDPAQLFPIGGEPCWSIKMKRTDRKDFGEDSYIGLADFRALFRMPKLEQVPNFDTWNFNELAKNLMKPNESKFRSLRPLL